MHRVLVFGDGWGGELFARQLKQDLAILEVERMIDWRHAPYGKKNWEEIARLTEKAIRAYVGEVDLIVIASYEATVAAIDMLRDKYPDQKFVGFEPRMAELLPADSAQSKLKRVALAGSEVVRRSIGYKVERSRLSLEHEVIEMDTANWSELVNRDGLTAEVLREDLARQGITGLGYATEQRIDAVLLYSTELADQKELLEEVMGWQIVVVSDFERMMGEVSVVLGIKSARGGPRRWR